ncbi:MAG: YceI family protein [Algibacter sp.]|uniref:YceI family protein n=1 Tax=Algibacter sp. TaxID=1872428 RepID=UPI0026342DB9|nr:YceI family protein [Algibacter sp.]MDG1728624.1 YceI family protein [Algibacter sp.]MDG2179609.1 YceI family protein [Algibacter sp.]
MKNLIIYFLLCFSCSLVSQNKYITKTGNINFEASVPAFEEVKAEHKIVTAILNSDNGEFAALALVKGFRFKNALMEEHFNENYAESDTYPKATFKGKIIDFDLSNLNLQASSFVIKGELTFHGKTIQFDNLDILISKNKDIISISGSFKTKAADFDIKIPKIVRSKIAKNIEVTFNYLLKRKLKFN